jgi:hypothetical protein
MFCKNYLWYNNGTENKRIHKDDDPPKGFVRGRISYWTEELSIRQSEKMTGKKRNLTEEQKKQQAEHAKNTIVKWQQERRAAGLPLSTEKTKEECLLYFKENPVFTRENYIEGSRDKNSTWRKAFNYYQSLLKYFKAEHDIPKDIVVHHINEHTNKYWDLRLNETVLAITKSEHADIHKDSGWRTEEANKKMRSTKATQEWKEQYCCKIICYETGEKYNGLKELNDIGLNWNKVWCCCNSNRKYNGDLNYKGRKKSGNFHWYFEGDTPQVAWWNYRRPFNDWKHRNQWMNSPLNSA